jgi:uncharacterized protein YsxB (DUF464 family)
MKRIFIVIIAISMQFSLFPLAKINMTVTKEYILKKVEIDGATSYAEKGKDIIASALSILIYTADLTLLKLDSVRINTIDKKDNYYSIEVIEIGNNSKDEVKGITLYLIYGFKLLERDYKDYIGFKLLIE